MYCSPLGSRGVGGPVTPAAAPGFHMGTPPMVPVIPVPPTTVAPKAARDIPSMSLEPPRDGMMSRVSSDGSQTSMGSSGSSSSKRGLANKEGGVNSLHHPQPNKHFPTKSAAAASPKVSFHDMRFEIRVVSLACLSEALRNDIWYSQADIAVMRSEARDLCRYVRVNPLAYPPEHTRGLELRISLERQCRKQMTVQGLVEAQRRCNDPDTLASISEKCSLVPKKMALAQAQTDYCVAYTTTYPFDDSMFGPDNNDSSSNNDNNKSQAMGPQSADSAVTGMALSCPAPTSQKQKNAGCSSSTAGPNMRTPQATTPPDDNKLQLPPRSRKRKPPRSSGSIRRKGYGGAYNRLDLSNRLIKPSTAYAQFGQFPKANASQPPQGKPQPAPAAEQPQHAALHLKNQSQQQQQQSQQLQQQSQQQQQCSFASFEPIPLATAAAAVMPADESSKTTALFGTVGNTKLPSRELLLTDPQSRMVRPRFGRYPGT